MEIVGIMPEGITKCAHCNKWATFTVGEKERIPVCENHSKGHEDIITEAINTVTKPIED